MATTTFNKNKPAYLKLYVDGELQRRVDKALAGLESCMACPWKCNINRLEDEKMVCRIGRYAWVASYFAHFGEEDCLRGTRGSGTIFFSWCNLRCVFCQNYDISQEEAGKEITPERLAEMMLYLQNIGCHNINWVTPEHVVPQILEAMPYAIEKGLHLPIVYNTSGFDSIESIRLMEGIVSIYMPDFKYWDPVKAKRYLNNENYPETTRQVIREMHKQVGDLIFDEKGFATQGLLVRHLVMPGALDDTEKIMQFLAEEISLNTYINIMDQYRPSAKVNSVKDSPRKIAYSPRVPGKISRSKYSEINRTITTDELNVAYQLARKAGLVRFDARGNQV